MVRLPREWIILIGLLVSCLLTGCQSWSSLRSDGSDDPEATWGRKYRAAQPSGSAPSPYFLDEKAQQIEKSLGL